MIVSPIQQVFLLAHCKDNGLYLRTLATGTELHSLKGHKSKVTIVTRIDDDIVRTNKQKKSECVCVHVNQKKKKKRHSHNCTRHEIQFFDSITNSNNHLIFTFILKTEDKRNVKNGYDQFAIQWYRLNEQSTHTICLTCD